MRDQTLRVMLRSSHCWERLLLQSLRVGTILSSSDGMSKHWLLFTCSRVSRWAEEDRNNYTHVTTLMHTHTNKSALYKVCFESYLVFQLQFPSTCRIDCTSGVEKVESTWMTNMNLHRHTSTIDFPLKYLSAQKMA